MKKSYMRPFTSFLKLHTSKNMISLMICDHFLGVKNLICTHLLLPLGVQTIKSTISSMISHYSCLVTNILFAALDHDQEHYLESLRFERVSYIWQFGFFRFSSTSPGNLTKDYVICFLYHFLPPSHPSSIFSTLVSAIWNKHINNLIRPLSILLVLFTYFFLS